METMMHDLEREGRSNGFDPAIDDETSIPTFVQRYGPAVPGLCRDVHGWRSLRRARRPCARRDVDRPDRVVATLPSPFTNQERGVLRDFPLFLFLEESS